MTSRDTVTIIFLAVALLTTGICLGQPVSTAVRCDPSQNLLSDARIEVSSSAGPFESKYGPPKMLDNDLSTWWATRRQQEPPQWVKLTLQELAMVDTVVLVTKRRHLYANWKRVRVEFSSGEPVESELPDNTGPHIIRFPERTVEWLQVTLLEGHEHLNNYVIAELLAFHDPDRTVEEKVDMQRVWRQASIEVRGRDTHPCVYATPEDVARARQNIERYEWAADYADSITDAADRVAGKSAEWVQKHMPGKGACFATGWSGCPVCDAQWQGYGRRTGSFDRPGKVKCPKCGTVFPNEEYPDPGTGYKADSGRMYYFKGLYNSFVVETYQDWSHQLAFAYMLTGDERYADTCGLLLDAIAEIYPTCDRGPWDWPKPESRQHGRLTRPGYQASRRLVEFVEDFDYIYNSPTLDKSSFVEGMTRRENIEQNLMLDAAKFCYLESIDMAAINNGGADYVRGALAVGCLLGIERYVDWAVDGPYGIRTLIANNIDRDGRYTETSLSYARHTRDLYLTFAEPLVNYRSEEYPDGLNLYDDGHFRNLYVLPMLEMDLAGHLPRYGDYGGPDTTKAFPDNPPFNPTDYRFAERIYARTTDPQVKDRFAVLLNRLADGDIQQTRSNAGNRKWLVLHASDVEEGSEAADDDLLRNVTQSCLFGQKGIGILRTPRNRLAQACLLRYGPSLNHGHFDDLNINYVGRGYALTYDLAKRNGSTHTQVGWGKQTASHNLVMVNETRQWSDGDVDSTGGSLHLFAGMPGMQIIDADADGVYRSENVEEYRRMLALVGTGPDSYLLDIFTVLGGRQHDYIMHALSTDVTFDGVELSSPAEGSVAGPEYNWGARQLNDGYMKGVPHKPYWNPPPGNGLGFLMEPQRGTPERSFAATWRLPDDQTRFRMTMPPQNDCQVVTAWAPGLYPHLPKSRYVMMRRESDAANLNSQFVAVLEPYGPPLPENQVSAKQLADASDTDGGSVRFLPNHSLVFFKADAPGESANFTFTVPHTGSWTICIGTYRSPGYGTVQFVLDGEALGEPFVGTRTEPGPGKELSFGPLELEAGTHTLTTRMVQAEAGNPWIGLRHLQLTTDNTPTDDSPPSPQVAGVSRIEGDDDTVGAVVERSDGAVDHFAYAREPAQQANCGTIQLTGVFGHVRTGETGVSQVHLIGESLGAPGIEVALAHGQHTGRVVEVDRDNNEVFVDAMLPTDGRLDNQVVTFDSPAYSRNTTYAIRGIRGEGDVSVIELGDQTPVLGKAVVDENPLDDGKITSLVPHEYGRGLTRGGTDFFSGKRLVSKDGENATTVTSTSWGTPFTINVEDSRGFSRGDVLYYIDIQARDTFTIRNWASITVDPDGNTKVIATDDLTFTISGTSRTYRPQTQQ